jgi:transposase InsO family protein
VGYGFNTSETISALTVVLKEAFMAYGIPKRLYVDNGPSFSSEILARSCAMAGISLLITSFWAWKRGLVIAPYCNR